MKTEIHMKNISKGKFLLWLASFLAAAVILIFYFKVPMLPLILGAILSFGITWIKSSEK